jgi:chromosome segregation ATPase
LPHGQPKLRAPHGRTISGLFHDAALQAERASSHGQIQQLMATINQLRIEIEVLEHKRVRELDEQLADFAREQANWKAQVQALRNELEQRA